MRSGLRIWPRARNELALMPWRETTCYARVAFFTVGWQDTHRTAGGTPALQIKSALGMSGQYDLCEFPDNFGFRSFVPRHSYIPLCLFAPNRCKLDSGNVHCARGRRHQRHSDPGAHQVEDGEHVVGFVNDSRSEARAIAQADAVIVISRGNTAIDENESLLLNSFHSYRPGKLG